MANFCGCWNIKDGCITVAVWTMIFCLIQFAIFGWQASVIKREKDVARNVMYPYNRPAQVFNRDQMYYEQDSGFYTSPEVRVYTAIFVVQILILVLTALLFVASAALAYGIYTEAHYLIWPWLPCAILSTLACLAYCIIWWIGQKELRSSNRPDLYTVTGYWYILTIIESVFALVNTYCIACVISLYGTIYKTSRRGSLKSSGNNVYYGSKPVVYQPASQPQKSAYFDGNQAVISHSGAGANAQSYYTSSAQVNPGYDLDRNRQFAQHQFPYQHTASTIQMSDFNAPAFGYAQPPPVAPDYPVKVQQQRHLPQYFAAAATSAYTPADALPPKRPIPSPAPGPVGGTMSQHPRTRQQHHRSRSVDRGAARHKDTQSRRRQHSGGDNSTRRDRDRPVQHGSQRGYRNRSCSRHRERRYRSDSDSSGSEASFDERQSECRHRRRSRSSRRSRRASSHSRTRQPQQHHRARDVRDSAVDNWSTSETELNAMSTGPRRSGRAPTKHASPVSTEDPHRVSSSSIPLPTSTPEGLVIPQTIYIPPPKPGHSGERRRFQIDNEIRINYSDRSTQNSPGQLQAAAGAVPIGPDVVERPGSTTV